MPQGSVLGPTLFIIYINDLDLNLNSYVLKFADDTKVFSQVSSCDHVSSLQSDLDSMYNWSQKWQMSFNTSKCKCLHIGYNNNEANYSIGGEVVDNVSSERDLGVLIDNSLSSSKHCAKAVATANKVLGMINRTYSCKSKENILCLYKSLVRPHLEYCCQIWRPYHQKDIDNIEKVQRRVTRMISECSLLNYSDRLVITGLLSLEMRRLRADLIEVFKIVKGFEKVNSSLFFEKQRNVRTRGHPFRFYKPNCRLDIRKYFFSQRVISEWNSLPLEAVTADTVNTFKNKIDPVLKRRQGLYISQKWLSAPVFKTPSASSAGGIR